MEGKTGSTSHRDNGTHTPKLLFYFYRVKYKGITTNFKLSVEVRGVNWSTHPVLILLVLVHQHFSKPNSTHKRNGATNQIVYYTPDKSVCHCLYKIK